MIGRASYGNPWIFAEIRHYLETGEALPSPTIAQRVEVAKRHLQSEAEWKGERQAILEIRKHWSCYFKGIANFKPYRMRLVEALSIEKINAILDEVDGVLE